jgi:hypothetical protein
VQINREKFTNYSGLKLDRVEFGQNIAYICGCGYAKGLWVRPCLVLAVC